ncbi:MAG: NfeD family protein, partial [Nitrospirota bacterium]
VIFPSVIATVLFFLFVVGMAVKSQRKKPVTGIEGLIGMTCLVKTDISPRGNVMLRGEIWDAVSDEPLKEGDKAEVLGVEGLKLLVKRYKQL